MKDKIFRLYNLSLQKKKNTRICVMGETGGRELGVRMELKKGVTREGDEFT